MAQLSGAKPDFVANAWLEIPKMEIRSLIRRTDRIRGC